MKKNYISGLLLCMGLCLTACEQEEDNWINSEKPTYRKITISSRTVDGDFAKGNQIGVYVSDQQQENGLLLPKGNYVDNMQFTYNGHLWTSKSDVYWKDEHKQLTFYAYSPYRSNVKSACLVEYKTSSRQWDAAYNRDFLYGRTIVTNPAETDVHIELKHVLSKLKVVVKPGQGTTKEDLKSNLQWAIIQNLKYKGSIDLSTGKVTVDSERMSESYLKIIQTGTFEGYFLPQEFRIGDKFLRIFYADKPYDFSKNQVLESGKMYTLTLTLSKSGGKINVSITGWEEVNEDYGGVVS